MPERCRHGASSACAEGRRQVKAGAPHGERVLQWVYFLSPVTSPQNMWPLSHCRLSAPTRLLATVTVPNHSLYRTRHPLPVVPQSVHITRVPSYPTEVTRRPEVETWCVVMVEEPTRLLRTAPPVSPK
jgi:hypothetical protein